MRIDRPPTLLQTNRKSIVSMIIVLSMVFLFAILVVFTVYKCEENCTFHNEYSLSCLNDGSLYCCKANIAIYSEKTCGQYSECQFDNSQCSDLIISLSLIGGILLFGVGVMIASAVCPKIFWKPAVDQTTVDDMHERIRDGLIEDKSGDDTTDSTRSSNVEPTFIN